MPAIHLQLLAQSAALSARDPGRPVQASVRRASRAAYYALFHFLLDEIGVQLVGAARRDRRLRQALARSVDHSAFRECADRFLAGPGSLPEPLRRCIPDGSAASEDLSFVAKSFVELQRMRHAADYDLGIQITRPEAERAHWLATESIARWQRIRGTREARVFGLAAVSWRGLRGR